MRIGMIGMGRMGSNMTRRLLAAGHECVVYDVSADAVQTMTKQGAQGVDSLKSLAGALSSPRAVWLMLPAAVVQKTIEGLARELEPGDTIIDGGNSDYRDDIARSRTLAERGLHYVDVGVSGGVWGLTRGYCLMIGGSRDAVAPLEPIFETLVPGIDAAPRTRGRESDPSPAEKGYLHCGTHGAGHFVKMVHNGIEYGLMAAYAEGLNILRHANVGQRAPEADAETSPLRNPEYYRYDLDLAQITELWRRGSVIQSWLLDLLAHALLQDPSLSRLSGRVSDSGEGRFALHAAVDEGVPAPVLSIALAERFASRGREDFAHKVLSALRHEFGGHAEASA